MYSIAELATARQHDADVTWLIVDDGGYGILREYMTDAFGQATATELARPDFVALADEFRCPGTSGDARHASARSSPARSPPAAPRWSSCPHCCGCSHPPTSRSDLTMGKPLDIAIIVVYLAAMLAFGFWGKTQNQGLGRLPGRRKATRPGALHRDDGRRRAGRRVDRRRCRPRLQVGHLRACGWWSRSRWACSLLSLLFAGRIQRLKVYTVAQMLRAAVRRRRHVVVRNRHGRLHVDAVGDVDDRLRDRLQRPVRHRPHGVGDHRRRDRHAVLRRSAACGRSR